MNEEIEFFKKVKKGKRKRRSMTSRKNMMKI
jgi:hypothetical protein